MSDRSGTRPHIGMIVHYSHRRSCLAAIVTDIAGDLLTLAVWTASGNLVNSVTATGYDVQGIDGGSWHYIGDRNRVRDLFKQEPISNCGIPDNILAARAQEDAVD